MNPLHTFRFEGREITILDAMFKIKALSDAVSFHMNSSLPLEYHLRKQDAYDALAEHMTGASNRNEPDDDGA